MARLCAALVFLATAAALCHARGAAPWPAQPALKLHPNGRTPQAGAMPIDTWSVLMPTTSSSAAAPHMRDLEPHLEPSGAEQVTVYAKSRRRDEDWRAALLANSPAYIPGQSDAAQPIVPFVEYTSPEQQRLMSEKTDALGLCGALGGYIQCPNLPP